MKKLLFDYCVIYHASEAEIKEGKDSKIINPPTIVLAKDSNEVLLKAAMEIPSEYKDKLSQVEIVIRPF